MTTGDKVKKGAPKSPEGVVSYPHLIESRTNELSGEEEYSVVLIFDAQAAKSKEWEGMVNAVKAARDSKWPNKAKRPKQLRSPFRKCSEKATEDEDTGETIYPDGYPEGGYFVTFKSRKKPGLATPGGKKMSDEDAATDIYAGCKGRVSYRAVAYDQKGNKGMSLWLINFQKTRNGKPIDGRPRPEDDFEAVEGADEEIEDMDDLDFSDLDD